MIENETNDRGRLSIPLVYSERANTSRTLFVEHPCECVLSRDSITEYRSRILSPSESALTR